MCSLRLGSFRTAVTSKSPPCRTKRDQGGTPLRGDRYDMENFCWCPAAAWCDRRRTIADADLWSVALLQRRLQLGFGAEHDHVRHAKSLADRPQHEQHLSAFGQPGDPEFCRSGEADESYDGLHDYEGDPDWHEYRGDQLLSEPRRARDDVDRRSEFPEKLGQGAVEQSDAAWIECGGRGHPVQCGDGD